MLLKFKGHGGDMTVFDKLSNGDHAIFHSFDDSLLSSKITVI